MRRARLLFLVGLVLVPRAGWPQGTPLGPEFRVNTYITGSQYSSSVAADASGNFVVVWTSDAPQDGSGSGVFGQNYFGSGTPLGPEFRVNTYTTGPQSAASVASDSSGNLRVVVWTSVPVGDPDGGVVGQRLGNSGNPLGPEFLVNTFTTSAQRSPSVAADASGNFVVVWQSYTQDGSSYGVFGQRFASSGIPLGPEFRVNTLTTSSQASPSVASGASGNFVVVWSSDAQDGSGFGIFGQRYASSGASLGPEFRVNTFTTGSQSDASVAADTSGNFVVVWNSDGQDGSSLGIFGQRYASSGASLGPEFRANTFTTSFQNYPSVAADPSGNFVVAWDSNGQDGSYRGIFGQRYSNSGAPLGPEFRVNTYTTSNQSYSSIAADSSGKFVVAWSSPDGGYGQGPGIFGQRYDQIVPGPPPVFVSIADAAVTEGDVGTANAVFNVLLSAPGTSSSSVSFATADVTATAPGDYQSASGTLTFSPGTTSQTVTVVANGDTPDEDDETFTVALSNPVNLGLGDALAVGTILDDDPLPSVLAGDAAVLETNAGTVSLPMQVTLNVPSGRLVMVDYFTGDGTATGGDNDYLPRTGTLSFPVGNTMQTVPVSVVGDTVPETDETLLLHLTNPVNVGIGATPGTGTLLDDDTSPTVYGGELAHGAGQVADLASTGPSVPSTLYRLKQRRYSSYEVVVDGASGDLGPSGPSLTRVDADGSTVIQSSIPLGAGASRSLRWQNATADDVDWQFLEIASLGCTTNCGPEDVYRIRAYETTLAVPRFNNSASQITVLQLQNPTASPVGGTLHFWSASGALLDSEAFSLAPHATLVLNTATLAGVSGQSGTLTVTHDARYGEMVGKAVALEPATGFTFDTPLRPRPR